MQTRSPFPLFTEEQPVQNTKPGPSRYKEIKERLSNLRAEYFDTWDELDHVISPVSRAEIEAKLQKLRADYEHLSKIFREMWPDD